MPPSTKIVRPVTKEAMSETSTTPCGLLNPDRRVILFSYVVTLFNKNLHEVHVVYKCVLFRCLPQALHQPEQASSRPPSGGALLPAFAFLFSPFSAFRFG